MFPLLQECTRTIPRGNPAPHTPLIAFYDQRAWPPRDPHSRGVIEQALASHTETNIAGGSSSSPAGDGRKRTRGGQCADGPRGAGGQEISPPSKRSRDNTPRSSGKKNRRKGKKKFKSTSDRDSTEEQGSLRITIDGRGFKTPIGGHSSLQDPSPPVNHVHPRARPSLLGTPPSVGGDYPRQPHPSSSYPSPLEYDSRFPPDQGRYTTSRSPSHNRERRETWHYDNPGHTFTPPSGARGPVSRSLSAGEHHLPSQHYRRHSEHLEQRYGHQQHDDIIPPLMATPTYPNPNNRGRPLFSSRGFQMSLEAAGLYDGRSPAGSRRYSQGHTR